MQLNCGFAPDTIQASIIEEKGVTLFAGVAPLNKKGYVFIFKQLACRFSDR